MVYVLVFLRIQFRLPTTIAIITGLQKNACFRRFFVLPIFDETGGKQRKKQENEESSENREDPCPGGTLRASDGLFRMLDGIAWSRPERQRIGTLVAAADPFLAVAGCSNRDFFDPAVGPGMDPGY